MRYIARHQLKSAPRDAGLRKEFVSSPLDLGERRIKFTVSTPHPDRSSDVINQNGWILDHYLRNPVVLWGHDADALPIGKCVSIGVEDDCLKAIVEFCPADVPVVGPMADAVYRLCRDGYLSATSVGFVPLRWDETDDVERGAGTYSAGVDFHSAELLEFSIVCTPDNPRCLIEPGQQTVADPVANDPGIVEASASNSMNKDNEKQRRARVMRLLGQAK